MIEEFLPCFQRRVHVCSRWIPFRDEVFPQECLECRSVERQRLFFWFVIDEELQLFLGIYWKRRVGELQFSPALQCIMNTTPEALSSAQASRQFLHTRKFVLFGTALVCRKLREGDGHGDSVLLMRNSGLYLHAGSIPLPLNVVFFVLLSIYSRVLMFPIHKRSGMLPAVGMYSFLDTLLAYLGRFNLLHTHSLYFRLQRCSIECPFGISFFYRK